MVSNYIVEDARDRRLFVPPRADGVQRLTFFTSLLAGVLEKKKPEGGRPVSLRLRASEALSSTLTLTNIFMCLKYVLHTRFQVGHSHQHVFDLLTPSALSYLPVFSSTFH